MSILVDIGVSLLGTGLIVLLLTEGYRIKQALGDSVYNIFVFISVLIGLFSASSFFSLIQEVFGDICIGSLCVFALGQYTALGLFAIIVIAKLLHWF